MLAVVIPSEKLPPECPDGGRPLYKVFSTENHRYLYDTATNQILTIPEDFARYLEKGVFSSEELEEFAADHRGGVLLPTSALPLSPGPSPSEVEEAVHNRCQQVVLEVTQDCNMRCRYCVYSGRQPGRRGLSRQAMPLETAFKAVDYLQAHSSRSPDLAIGFFGGEPLLTPSLIQRTTDYARQVIKGKDLVFSLTTNGTLLNREIMSFLVANSFSTFVSLDGPPEINDRNRVFGGEGKGSYGVVMSRLRDFQQAYPEYYRRTVRLSMVAPPGTDYVRVAEWLRAGDFEVAMSSLVGDDTGEFERAYRERPVTGEEQLRREFIEAHCRGALDERKGQLAFSLHAVLFSATLWLLKRRPVPTSPRERAIRRGICVPGSDRLFVDCNGDLFPCEKTDGRRHLRLGHIDSGVDVRKVNDILVAFHEFLAQECSSCWLWRLCRVCLPGPTMGDGFDRDTARRLCEGHRQAMVPMLEMYCAILERNPNALDSFVDDK